MGRPFLAESQLGDPRCDPVSYDPDRPITPDAFFGLPDAAVRLIREAVDATVTELSSYHFLAFLDVSVEKLRAAVPCDRAYAEAVAGMLYLTTEAFVKAERGTPRQFWRRLFGEFFEHTRVVISVVRYEPGKVVLKTEDGDEVACEHGRVVAFMGRAYRHAIPAL